MLYTRSPENSLGRFIPDFHLSWTECVFGDIRNLFWRQFLQTWMPEHEQKEAEEHAPTCSWLGAIPLQWSTTASYPEWLPSSSLWYRLRNTCTTTAAMPHNHYFMNPPSLAAFHSAQPCCSFAHLSELFGKAQPRASRYTICPLLRKKNTVREVLAFSLMLMLKGQRLGYQSCHFAWPPVQLAFFWSAAKPKLKSGGFGKVQWKREGERTGEHTWKHAMKIIKLTAPREKDSEVESFSFYWPSNMFKTGKLKLSIKFLKWQTLSEAFPSSTSPKENEKLGFLSCCLLGGGGYERTLT